MPANDDRNEFEERGVYLARWKTMDGSRVMYAVTSDGTKLDHLAIRGTVTPATAFRLLSEALDAADPKPTLRLVREERPAEPVSRGAFLALHGLIRRQSPPSA